MKQYKFVADVKAISITIRSLKRPNKDNGTMTRTEHVARKEKKNFSPSWNDVKIFLLIIEKE